MQVPLVGIIRNGSLIITSDPKLANYEFKISNHNDACRGPSVKITGLFNGLKQDLDVEISIVTAKLGITPEQVLERDQAKTLFVSHDGREGETIVLPQEIEDYLSIHGDTFRKEAAKQGRNKNLSKTRDGVPASMCITPEGFIFVHNKSYNTGDKGAHKHHKTAIMISPDGESRLVSRLVVHISDEDKMDSITTENEVKILSELQTLKHQEGLYGFTANKNKEGKDILTIYVQNFPDGSFFRAKEKMDYKGKIAAAGKAVESYYLFSTLGYTHNDIKLENFLCNLETGEVVLADFGFARKGNRESADLDRGTPDSGTLSLTDLETEDSGRDTPDSSEGLKRVLGTEAYWSPEKTLAVQLKLPWTEKDDSKADVWALGALLYELFIREDFCSSNRLFTEELGVDIISRISPEEFKNGYLTNRSSMLEELAKRYGGANRSLMGAPGSPILGATPLPEAKPGDLLEELVSDMLHLNPDERPTVAEVLERYPAAARQRLDRQDLQNNTSPEVRSMLRRRFQNDS
jgi:serine/threonine protein kinase